MHNPEPDHVMFITKWASEVITGLIAILVFILGWIGRISKTRGSPYVTHPEMIQCQEKLMDEFRSMRSELVSKIDGAHDQIHKDINHAHARIDKIFERQ